MFEDIRPTRAALLDLKKKIVVTGRGHRYLRLKREGMLIEIRKLVRETSEQHARIASSYRNARDTLAEASMMEGVIGVEIVSGSIEEEPDVSLTGRNVMGVTIPGYRYRMVRKNLDERGYGLLGTSSIIDELADAFEDLLEETIRGAALEASLRRLLIEFEKTRRRVNALEYLVMPDLYRARDRIQRQRDELEREEFSRLFRHKKLKGER